LTPLFQKALNQTKMKIVFTPNTPSPQTVESSFGAGEGRRVQAEHPDPQPALPAPGRAARLQPRLAPCSRPDLLRGHSPMRQFAER